MRRKNPYPNVDRPNSKAFYQGRVEHHLLADTIAEWFAVRGFPSKPIVSNHDFSSWTYYDGDERLAYHFGISRDYRSQVQVTATIVFALLPLEEASNAAVKLLRQNGCLLAPAKYCVLLIDHCALKFDCHAQSITEDQLKYRLDFLFDLAIHSRNQFIAEEFGLMPLPDTWFGLRVAN